MKKFFAKIHLWLSIPFGLIIAIVCITGGILVFETELLELCYPSRYFVKEVKERPMPIADLMEKAREQIPESVKLNGIRITPDANRTYQIVLPGKKTAAFIDPYTGEVTGINDGKGFFMQTMRLHRWLLDKYKQDGSFFLGRNIVGYATIAFAIIVISGVVIWIPRKKKALKSRLVVNTRSGWYRFFYDLHVAGGFYSALLLLVMALTGLTWSFDWYRDGFYAVFGISTKPTTTTPPPKKADKGGDGVKNEEVADYSQWAKVYGLLAEEYDYFNSITIQQGLATVSSAKYGNTRAIDRYTFNSITGEVISTQLYKDLPNSAKIRGWIYSVHVGSWGGIVTRILFCMSSLFGGFLVLTGYYFWINNKRKQRVNKAKRRRCN